MPDKPLSPEAMRAARAINDYAKIHESCGIVDVATIIDREMEPKWIKCSERMPADNVWVLATYGAGI